MPLTRKQTLMSASALVVLANACGAMSVSAPAMDSTTMLTGSQEVPPVDTKATATSSIAVGDDMSVTGSVTVSGIEATMAHIHEGAFGVSGPPIVTLVNLGQVYLRAFVPGGDIGRVRVGQPARVYLDSAPNTPIDAQVIRIDPEASFTPENTYFREDRVKQVVGVKLLINGALGFAKPGMPADGEILVDGQWPARPARR